MPIDAETLRKKGVEVVTRKRGHRQDVVLAFLEENADAAYTQKELAAALSTKDFTMRPQQANQILRSLEKKGLVMRRSVNVEGKNLIHWAIVT